jgi:hypothetical protein
LLVSEPSTAGHPKDRIALPILIATLQERDKGKQSSGLTEWAGPVGAECVNRAAVCEIW